MFRSEFDSHQRLESSDVRKALECLEDAYSECKKGELTFLPDPASNGHDVLESQRRLTAGQTEFHEEKESVQVEDDFTAVELDEVPVIKERNEVIISFFIVGNAKSKKNIIVVKDMARDAEAKERDDRIAKREITETILAAQQTLKHGTLLIPIKQIVRKHAVLIEVDLDSKPCKITTHDWRQKWREKAFQDHLKTFVDKQKNEFIYEYKCYGTQENSNLCGYFATAAVHLFLKTGDSSNFPKLKMNPKDVVNKTHFNRNSYAICQKIILHCDQDKEKISLSKPEIKPKLVLFFDALLTEYKKQPKYDLLLRCRNIINNYNDDAVIYGIFICALQVVLQKQKEKVKLSDETTVGKIFLKLINKKEFNLIKYQFFDKVLVDVVYQDLRHVGMERNTQYTDDKRSGVYFFSADEDKLSTLREQINAYERILSQLISPSGASMRL